jgi:hypothetical protein
MSDDAVWVRGVTGIQLHHQTDLGDADRFLGNAAMAVRSAHTRTADRRYSELMEQIKAVGRLVHEFQREAAGRMGQLHDSDPERFVRCREGEEPWPDEIAAGFIPRHTCRDKCLYHDAHVLDAITQCICARPPCEACTIGFDDIAG